MKKIIFLLIITNLLFVQHLYAAKSVWDGRSSDTSWYNENLSEYHISSAAQFKGFADLVSYNYCSFEGKTIFLDCDIDLDNHFWSPIGLHSSKPFSGNFDGLLHSITNLRINSNEFEYPDMKDNVGLFGYAVNAEIKNLSVQGVLEISNGKYIGGVAAYVKRIENIYSDITILLTATISANIGNVVCRAEEAFNIYSKGEIRFNDSFSGFYDGSWVGGIAGSCGEMHKCLSCVEMHINRIGASSQIQIGGISGQSSNISDIIFTGSIDVNNVNCSSDQFIPKSGGICGAMYGSGTNIISAPTFLYLGRGWAIGKSIIIPSTSSDANISNAYYLNMWATDNEVFGIPVSESELKSGSPLSGFDTSIWEFNENEYPSLISLKSLIPQPTYTVSYYVDGELYQVDEYKDGETVVPPADPTKEGYTFDGWGYIPPFISGNSWIVYGSFSINSYIITYMIDDEVFATVSQEYNSYIYPPSNVPSKQGYYFSWGEYPTTVPAHDVTIVGYYTQDTYECVDLGLPSGLLWATKNVGAINPEDIGDYFSWGEIHPKESYYWGTYNYCNGSATSLTKYCNSYDYGNVDNKETLEKEDDAATANWGAPWRLPTLEETQELISLCTWTNIKSGNKNGYIVTGPNGNSIFIPAAGVIQYMTHFYYDDACLLSSTIFNASNGHADYASVLYCEDGNPHWWYGWDRCWGYSVRPVTNTDPNGIKKLTLSDSNEIKGIYDVQGKRLSNVKKGVNIIREKDGRTRKVVVR